MVATLSLQILLYYNEIEAKTTVAACTTVVD